MCLYVFMGVYVHLSVCVFLYDRCAEIFLLPRYFVGPHSFHQQVPLPSKLFTLAYLSSVPHVNEGTHGLEGTGATGKKVGAVVGLQEANKVGTLRLQNIYITLKPCILKKYVKRYMFFMKCFMI